ncbi:MAG: hypothetical protein JOY83_19150 [Alphaproteobacteria bacterium]|nr:hypothetical protein [Alphaproteobacteria bacterium]
MESAIEENRDRDRIVDEAVGQTHGTPPPAEARERQSMSPEEATRRNAPAPGAQASMAEKTAASMGERVWDAIRKPEAISGASLDRVQHVPATRRAWPIAASPPGSIWPRAYALRSPINGSRA